MFSVVFSVSVKFFDHVFSVTIKFQLRYFSFYFSYYGDFSVSVPVSVVYVRIAMFDSQIKLTIKLIVSETLCWLVSYRHDFSFLQ